jgi:hypothetical protein
MKSAISALLPLSLALALGAFAAACGGGESSTADAQSLCKHLVEILPDDGAKDADAELSACIKQMNEQKKAAGNEIFEAYVTCAKKAKDQAGLKPCSETFDKDMKKREDELFAVRMRVYDVCSEMGKNQVLLERLDESGGRNWGHACTDAVMELRDSCDPKKAEEMLTCLDSKFDPDDLSVCTKLCGYADLEKHRQ